MFQLDFADYLLLDYAALYPTSFAVFFRPERVNKPSIDLDVEEISWRLLNLASKKLILIVDKGERVLELSLREFNQMLQERIEIWQDDFLKQWEKYEYNYPVVKLTTLGGMIWEDFFEPNWEKYYCDQGEVGDVGDKVQWIIEAHHHLIIEEVIRLHGKYTQFVSNSETGKILEPWSVTYWKKLPFGYKVTLTVIESEEVEWESIDKKRLYELRAWRREWRENWCEGLHEKG